MNENSHSMRWEKHPANRRHTRNFILGMVWYTVTLFATLFLINARFEESIIRYFLVLIPVPGGLWAIWSSVRGILNLDELAQKIQTESAMIAALITAALTFTYGFLELVGFPKMGTVLFLPIMLGLWGTVTPFVIRKYK